MASEASSRWSNRLRSTTTRDILARKTNPLITLTPTTTLKDALSVLAEHNILSAPVMDGRQFLGFVDVLDVAACALSAWKAGDAAAPQQAGGAPDDTRAAFFSKPVLDVINWSRLDAPVVVEQNTSLLHVIDAMCSPTRAFTPHRAAVLDGTGVVFNVISQSDIVRFAAEFVAELQATTQSDEIAGDSQYLPSQKLIKDMQIGQQWPHGCVSVRADTPLVAALELLHSKRISGVAVVDNEQRLVGNLSASDLRGMTPKTFEAFSAPVIDFLKSKGLRRPVTIADTLPIGALVTKLASERLHRVFITDSAAHLTGLISVSDVVNSLQSS